MKHGYRRAACHERLLINMKHLGLKDTVEWTQALADPPARLRQGHRRALEDRGDGRRRVVARAEGGQAHPQGRRRPRRRGRRRLLFRVGDDDEDVVEVDAAGAPTNQRLELVESVAEPRGEQGGLELPVARRGS